LPIFPIPQSPNFSDFPHFQSALFTDFPNIHIFPNFLDFHIFPNFPNVPLAQSPDSYNFPSFLNNPIFEFPRFPHCLIASRLNFRSTFLRIAYILSSLEGDHGYHDHIYASTHQLQQARRLRLVAAKKVRRPDAVYVSSFVNTMQNKN